HLVLRGGKRGPNYDVEHVQQAAKELTKLNLNPRVMIDCSHDNTQKDYTRQPIVLQNIADQLVAGSKHIMGVMLESHLVAGKQSIPQDLSQLTYGQSITDACINFQTTTTVLRDLATAVKQKQPIAKAL
ncbi:MAG TPA: 3-deoxy-7-phosphoheptulonate synthase, partial [Allocoleopsis sp.]